MRCRIPFMVLACSLALQGTALPAMAEKNPSEQEFCRLDRNNDRSISLEEFAACEFYKLEHVKELPYAEPNDLRQRTDIRISDDELKAYLFKKADKNKDQMINRKEWEEFYNSLMDMEPEGGASRRDHDLR